MVLFLLLHSSFQVNPDMLRNELPSSDFVNLFGGDEFEEGPFDEVQDLSPPRLSPSPVPVSAPAPKASRRIARVEDNGGDNNGRPAKCARTRKSKKTSSRKQKQ